METTPAANTTQLVNLLWETGAQFQRFADCHHIGILWADMIDKRSVKTAWDVAHKINNLGAPYSKDLSALKSVACALAGSDFEKATESCESALFHAKKHLREITERFEAFNLGAATKLRAHV